MKITTRITGRLTGAGAPDRLAARMKDRLEQRLDHRAFIDGPNSGDRDGKDHGGDLKPAPRPPRSSLPRSNQPARGPGRRR